MEIGGLPGVWRRAGQGGTPCGLDWGQAIALLPEGELKPRVLALLRTYEGGLIEGAAETARRHAEEAKRRAK